MYSDTYNLEGFFEEQKMNNLVKKVQVTQSGFEALQKELADLVDQKRPQVVSRLERARQEGDLKENSDYLSAKEELEFLDGRIDELKEVIDNAVIVNGSNAKKGEVGVGTRVTLKSNGTEHVYEIVGEWEADPMQKRISHESPLGKALVGKRVGEEAEVEAPAGKIVYQILKVD